MFEISPHLSPLPIGEREGVRSNPAIRIPNSEIELNLGPPRHAEDSSGTEGQNQQ